MAENFLGLIKKMIETLIPKRDLDHYDLIDTESNEVLKTVKLTAEEARRKNGAFQLNRARKLYVLSGR